MVTAAFAVLLLLLFVCRNGMTEKTGARKGGKMSKRFFFFQCLILFQPTHFTGQVMFITLCFELNIMCSC